MSTQYVWTLDPVEDGPPVVRRYRRGRDVEVAQPYGGKTCTGLVNGLELPLPHLTGRRFAFTEEEAAEAAREMIRDAAARLVGRLSEVNAALHEPLAEVREVAAEHPLGTGGGRSPT